MFAFDQFMHTSVLLPPPREQWPGACRAQGEAGYAEVALGQGQTDAAAAAVRSAAAAGTWVCLKNMHLAVWWLPQLERLLQQLTRHADFRLWLTTEPHPLIPAGLLSTSLVRHLLCFARELRGFASSPCS